MKTVSGLWLEYKDSSFILIYKHCNKQKKVITDYIILNFDHNFSYRFSLFGKKSPVSLLEKQ